MKKYVGLLLVAMTLVMLVACGGTQASERPDLDGFHFIYNDAGDYIWLGMTLEDVERIDFSEEDSLTVADTSDVDDRFYGRFVLTNRWFGLMFDDNERVSYIAQLWTEGPWLVRGDITSGSTLSEVEEIFDMDYVHIGSLLSWWSFYFTYDHIPVHRESVDAYYSITFATDRERQEQVTGFIIEKIEH